MVFYFCNPEILISKLVKSLRYNKFQVHNKLCILISSNTLNFEILKLFKIFLFKKKI